MLGLKDKLSIVLVDKKGNIKATQKTSNIITNGGFDYLCQRIGQSRDQSMIYAGVGTNDTDPDTADTTLGDEVARISGIYSHIDGTKVFSNESTFGPGVGTGFLKEAGLFDTISAGTMLNRTTFPEIRKEADDILILRWEVELSEV